MFALVMGRVAIGPIDAPFALVESKSVKKIKESRLSMMNKGRTVTEKRGSQVRLM